MSNPFMLLVLFLAFGTEGVAIHTERIIARSEARCQEVGEKIKADHARTYRRKGGTFQRYYASIKVTYSCIKLARGQLNGG